MESREACESEKDGEKGKKIDHCFFKKLKYPKI